MLQSSESDSRIQNTLINTTQKFYPFSFFLSPMGQHTHASAEACIVTGWPNAQPQGWD